ncbi:MAG: heavy metal translocating P-type ATPase, partial [Bacillota bacterium]|nr:heavy metal translocating P-type ATPase [Bacillota bacterium]
HGHGHDHGHEHGGDERSTRILLGISILLFALGFFWGNWFFLAAYLVSGHRVLIRAGAHLMRGDFLDEFFLMSIATIGAIAIGEIAEGAAVMIFFGIGEYFQDRAINHSKRSISELVALRPDQANRILEDGSIVTVRPEEIRIGDHILVKPGERIPLDGVLVSEHAEINNAALTGESLPVLRAQGEEVLSGGIALGRSLTLRVTKDYDDSAIVRIIKLVAEASSNKAQAERFISKFAKYYTPAVVGLAVLIAIIPPFFAGWQNFSDWFYRALLFLVISCPCALVVSVPLGFFAGIGKASRNGILVKGSGYLEALAELDEILLDKTGTLTTGEFEVDHVEILSPLFAEAAYLAENESTHPIARAIIRHLEETRSAAETHSRLRLIEKEEVSGKGIRATTDQGELLAGSDHWMRDKGIAIPERSTDATSVYIALGGSLLGYLDVRDTIKSDSHAMVQNLNNQRIRTAMLTGDRREVANRIAGELGLSDFEAELLPQDKHRVVQERIASGKKVGFVGDGINDAPVLAGATVGISIGLGGSDAAIEASDIVLISDEMMRIPRAIEISRQTRTIVTQNIVFSLAIKAIILVLGAAGFANMWLAILADVGVTLLAVLNSLRILRD